MRMRNKSKISTIALVLVLAMAVSLVALPAATAQEPYRKKTYAIIDAIPNPVGVGQAVLLQVGITDATEWPQEGWEDLTVTVVRPDGTTETLGPITTDTTGSTGVVYVPDQVGTYTFQTHFPEQVATVPTRGLPAGTVFEASDSKIVELIVQEEELPWYPGVPLPTEYWTRSIDAQAREWYTISGNWLDSKGYWKDMEAPYNDYAPETAHILWAKPLLGTAGGALGGGLAGGATGETSFECGDAYEGYFTPPVIIGGVLYFNRYKADGGTRVEQEVVAVDLRTGEELWAKPLLDPDGVSRRIDFGQTYYWDGFNIHGVYAYLWATVFSTWHAFEASSGRWIYSMTNVPAFPFFGALPANVMFGPKGEILIYTVNLAKGWMTKWNSEKVVTEKRLIDTEGEPGSLAGSWLREYTGTTFDASLGYEWNETIPTGLPGTARVFLLDDRIIGTNIYKDWPAPETIVFWAISTKPEQEGLLLFNRTWTRPLRDAYMMLEAASVEDGVFVVVAAETGQHWGFDIDTGEQIWGPSEEQSHLDRYTFASSFSWDTIYNGKLYSAGMGGIVYCYDVTTGELLWTYESEDPYVFTEHWQRELGAGRISTLMLFFAGGKLYISDNEHSPNNPLARGAAFIALDAETGEEMFKLHGLFKGTVWGGQAVIGDSIIATMDTYDSRVYAIGRGPSATGVSASPKIIANGATVLIEGRVTDESPGAKEPALTARFPNGVPAIADEFMSEWMLYVYKQFPAPLDATGVDVLLQAMSSDGTITDIATVTSDAYGCFSYKWTPPDEDVYTIMAIFLGSKSYWPSYAQTGLGVGPEPTPYPEYPEPVEAPAYTAIELGIIAAVIVTLVLVIYTLFTVRKQRK